MNDTIMGSDINDLEEEMNGLIDKTGHFIESFPEVQHWELFGGISRLKSIKIEKGYPKHLKSTQSTAITGRFYKSNGSIGSMCVTRLSKPSVESSIKSAIKLMRSSIPNPEFIGLAEPPEKYPNIKTIWDPDISELKIEDTERITKLFLEQMHKDKKDRIKSISGGFGYSDSRISVVNSNGINISEKSTSVSLSAEFMMEEMVNGNKENSTGYDWQSYNEYKSVEPQSIFDFAYNMAVQGLKKVKIETNFYPVIFSPMAVDLLICSPICAGLNALSVYQKRSFLQDKLDKQIGSEILGIRDDPWLDGGLETSPFDVEGTPTRPLNVLENGIVKSFLHNSYTANLFNTNSTGHASRGFYSASIGIATSNIIMKNGNKSIKSMISETDNGIYLEYSGDSPNIVTGEFSGLIANGYLIEDGKLGRSLKETMLGVNLLELYNKIENISKETKRMGSVYLPYVKVSALKISGSK
ncbi:MAG: TldD/PmbA family protein [Promethearchaeota archaeon]